MNDTTSAPARVAPEADQATTQLVIAQQQQVPTARDARVESLRAVFQPRTMEEAVALAARVAASNVCPQRYRGNPEDVFVAAAFGAEIGLSFMQSLQGVAVINGVPAIYGDHALGVVRASGLCLYVEEWIDSTDADNLVAHCKTHRRGEPNPVVRTFSEDDAEDAGLLSKSGPWQTHRKRMLQMRARGFCLRDTYADVLRGLHLIEELQDEDLVGGDAPLQQRPAAERAARAELRAEAEIPMPQAQGAEVHVDEHDNPQPVSPQAEPEPAAPPARTRTRERTRTDARAAREEQPAAAAPAEVTGDLGGIDDDTDAPTPEYLVERVSQRSTETGVIYTVELLTAGPAPSEAPVVARTEDRGLAVIARAARNERQVVLAQVQPDADLGMRLVSISRVQAS